MQILEGQAWCKRASFPGLLKKFIPCVTGQNFQLNFSLIATEELCRQPDVVGIRKAWDGNSWAWNSVHLTEIQFSQGKTSRTTIQPSRDQSNMLCFSFFFNTGILTSPSETFDWYGFLQNAGKTHLFSEFTIFILSRCQWWKKCRMWRLTDYVTKWLNDTKNEKL